MALIEMRGVTKAFGEQVVLDRLDLDVERGEFLTIMGVSGSGKSILLKCLIGLLPIDEGTIHFDGELVSGLSEQDWAPVRERIGMLFQEYALFDSLSVAENVTYGLTERGEMSAEAMAHRVDECLKLVALPGIEALVPGSLSGGMKKRVSLARAIASHPEVVLLDEPTEGLDPINVTRVDRMLLALQKKTQSTQIAVTHNVRSAFATSSRLAFLDEGRVHITGTPEELRASDDPLVRKFVGRRLD